MRMTAARTSESPRDVRVRAQAIVFARDAGLRLP